MLTRSGGLLLVATLLLAAGCRSDNDLPADADDEVIAVRNVWVRAMPDSLATRTAAYGEITNSGTASDELVAVDVDAVGATELHETTIIDDVMRMREIESVAIAPGATVALEPGGLHVMLLGMERQLVNGDSVQMTFEFSSGNTIRATAPVRDN